MKIGGRKGTVLQRPHSLLEETGNYQTVGLEVPEKTGRLRGTNQAVDQKLEKENI